MSSETNLFQQNEIVTEPRRLAHWLSSQPGLQLAQIHFGSSQTSRLIAFYNLPQYFPFFFFVLSMLKLFTLIRFHLVFLFFIIKNKQIVNVY